MPQLEVIVTDDFADSINRLVEFIVDRQNQSYEGWLDDLPVLPNIELVNAA